MKLTDYIFGSRRGRDANGIERQAMVDPFLGDALDGYDSVYGNHSDIITELNGKVASRVQIKVRLAWFTKRRLAFTGSAAAILLVAITVLMVYTRHRPAVSGEMLAVELSAFDETVHETPDGGSVPEMGDPDANGRNEFAVSSDVPEAGVAAAVDAGMVSDDINAAKQIATELGNDPAAETTGLSSEGDHNVSEPVVAVRSRAAVEHSEDQVAVATVASAAPEVQPTEKYVAEQAAGGAHNVRTVRNEAFEKYFAVNHRALIVDGKRFTGTVIAEFRVNDAGIPTSIKIISGISPEANRKVIELLVSGPVWRPTGDERIRTELKY